MELQYTSINAPVTPNYKNIAIVTVIGATALAIAIVALSIFSLPVAATVAGISFVTVVCLTKYLDLFSKNPNSDLKEKIDESEEKKSTPREEVLKPEEEKKEIPKEEPKKPILVSDTHTPIKKGIETNPLDLINEPKENPLKKIIEIQRPFFESGGKVDYTFNGGVPVKEGPFTELLANHILPHQKEKLQQKRDALLDHLKHSDKIVKPLFFEVNGQLVEVYVVMSEESIKENRWVLYSNGVGTLAEDAIGVIPYYPYKDLNANMIFFNYPGVGGSTGKRSAGAFINAYLAVLNFLEKEMKATAILLWGTSFGGAVQGASIAHHDFKSDIRYAAVKDQTLKRFSTTVSESPHFMHAAGQLVASMGGQFPNDQAVRRQMVTQILNDNGWELETKSSSLKITFPEIFIQKSNKVTPEKPEDILSDGVISDKASSARSIIKRRASLVNKTFVGVSKDHCQGFTNEEIGHISKILLNLAKA